MSALFMLLLSMSEHGRHHATCSHDEIARCVDSRMYILLPLVHNLIQAGYRQV